jgi:hypothetical protein
LYLLWIAAQAMVVGTIQTANKDGAVSYAKVVVEEVPGDATRLRGAVT